MKMDDGLRFLGHRLEEPGVLNSFGTASPPGVNYIVILLCSGFPIISILKRIAVAVGWVDAVNVFLGIGERHYKT